MAAQIPGHNTTIVVLQGIQSSATMLRRPVILSRAYSEGEASFATGLQRNEHVRRNPAKISHSPVGVTSPPGKVWFITGTSSGFGRRLVDIVLARGDRVIATVKTASKINHLLEDPALGSAPNLYCAELDIATGTERVKERIDDIIQASGWGTVDMLVNNAGFAFSAFVEEGGVKLLRSQYQTNVFGTLDVTTAVLPYMRKRSGAVVMIGSRSAWRTELKGLGFYGSSKAAMRAIAETMAIELEPFGIRTLIVEPGSFRTEGIYRNDFDESNPIPDYNDKRGPAARAFAAPSGKQPGDPAKAMRALVEVVCGEGRAQGKAWPLYLVLGKDAEQDVRRKCTVILSHLDQWSDIVRDVDLDDLD